MISYFMKRITESLTRHLEIIRNVFLNFIMPLILLIETGFNLIWKKEKLNVSNKSKNNIIIIGGSLANKGAQAMTFTVVDQMSRRFPNKKFYLFSIFESETNQSYKYKFTIKAWTNWHRILLSSVLHKYFLKTFKRKLFDTKLENIVENAALIIDISGYRFSSQFDQNYWIFYILDIIIAKKQKIPYLIFPQSIGPFNFSFKNRIFFYPLAKYYLKYPKVIFSREYDGLRYLNQFKNINIKKTFDIVIQNEGYNLSNIYREEIKIKDYNILPNSVCIIPNRMVNERIKTEEIYSIYSYILKKLMNANKNVYILRHSNGDIEICEKIKNLLTNNERIYLISDDLNVIEIENLIKKFDFVIASRYHSIIHAYKNGVPAIVIGWAIKYYELLDYFKQADYYYDIRDLINIEIIEKSLEKMLLNFQHEKEKIKSRFESILKKRNCFDIINKNIQK